MINYKVQNKKIPDNAALDILKMIFIYKFN